MGHELLKKLRRIWPEEAKGDAGSVPKEPTPGPKEPTPGPKEPTPGPKEPTPGPKGGADPPGEVAEPAARTCVDCGTAPPQTVSEYTLISAQHGWRLSRKVTVSGKTRLEWRCPTCWAKRRPPAK